MSIIEIGRTASAIRFEKCNNGDFTIANALEHTKYALWARNEVLKDFIKLEWEDYFRKFSYPVDYDRYLYEGYSGDELQAELERLKELQTELEDELKASPQAPMTEPIRKINIQGGLKELAAILLELEGVGRIDHVTDKQAAELFTIKGAPVNPDSLKTVRNRDMGNTL